MVTKNAFYAQSGGVTAVINATASGLLQTAKQYPTQIGTVYAGLNGILGGLQEDLIDTSTLTPEQLNALLYTPGGAFGSCRYKLKDIHTHQREYERLMDVFKAHNIGYFFYNGGGDSQDTAYKVSQISEKMKMPIVCIGIPKTIDNDLLLTDNCPGFGSVAKYVAVSIREAGLDVASMASSSTKVFILEVMGRHTGWIAGAAGLASDKKGKPPHIILFPEIPFNETLFCQAVQKSVEENGYCAIVVSEGLKNAQGNMLSESDSKDAFGHSQLGGAAIAIAKIVKEKLKLKYHYAISDYLQRAARHIASAVDVAQAFEVGQKAVALAMEGHNAVMPIIVRTKNHPYEYRIQHASLKDVANHEKLMPRSFITPDGYHITEEAREYFLPLIQGENYPPYRAGLPDYLTLEHVLVPKKLPPFNPFKPSNPSNPSNS